MAYTTINKSSLHFNTKTYTGNGSAGHAITGVGFQPDWTWIKRRDATTSHELYDAVRGVLKEISSDNGAAETTDPSFLSAFGTDGFTVGNHGGINNNGNSYVSWNWKAGGGQGSSNTDGSINTTYTSANTTAGFSISVFAGTGANATVGHGLGSIPEWVIVKGVNNTGSWTSYHKSLGNTKYMHLSENDAQATASSVWNSTTPTSSVISVGPGVQSGSGNTYVAYCFAPKRGFSKMGSYTGTGNVNGSFIYTGFKPAWIIVKRYDSGSEDWNMWDSKRIGYNIIGNDKLYANLNLVEDTGASEIDILSNGFKWRTTNGGLNANGGTYIYMCFAEAPFVGSNNVPANAR